MTNIERELLVAKIDMALGIMPGWDSRSVLLAYQEKMKQEGLTEKEISIIERILQLVWKYCRAENEKELAWMNHE